MTRETRQHSPGSQRAQDLFVRVITTALYLSHRKNTRYLITIITAHYSNHRAKELFGHVIVTQRKIWGLYKLFFYLFIPFKQKLCIGF